VLGFANAQPDVDAKAWVDEMVAIFTFKYKKQRTHYVGKVTEVLSDLFDLVRKYKVRVDPVYTNLLFSCMVQESFLNSLDPEFDVIARAKPYLFKDQSMLTSWLGLARNYAFRKEVT